MAITLEQTYATLDAALYAFVEPVFPQRPTLLLANHGLLDRLGLSVAELETLVAGPDRPVKTVAQAYAGHQFGQFTILGDGRALLLGDFVAPDGRRYDIQLKGSGRTPYSRGGDGKATVSSILREYLYSESLSALGMKSSRSLAVFLTGETVYRKRPEAGALLVRLMESHVRTGTFEYAAWTGSRTALAGLADYVIARQYPHLAGHREPYLDLFAAVMDAQAAMVVDWLRTGFIHGVMNTDNMSIGGETFDYGPCAFMNRYHPETVFSSIDTGGRYAFRNQVAVLGWNLARLAESCIPLVDPDPDAAVAKLHAVFEGFGDRFAAAYDVMMRAKLGLPGRADGGPALVGRLLDWMERARADYTNSFLELETPGSFDDPVYRSEEFQTLLRELESAGMDRAAMRTANPRVIPRNHLVEEALAAYAASGSLEACERLLQAVQDPDRDGFDRYREPPDEDHDVRYRTYCNT